MTDENEPKESEFLLSQGGKKEKSI